MKLSELFTKHGSDKCTDHSYGPIYDKFYPVEDRRKIKDVLEIGVLKGASLKALQEFFGDSVVYGIDKRLPDIGFPFSVWACDQGDTRHVTCVAGKVGHIDLVIDDGSHRFNDQWVSFLALWPNVKHGGRYIIEDVTSIDRWRLLEGVPGFTLYDLRDVKGRSDDVMVVFEKF